MYNCVTDDTKEMHKWISALSPRRWIASVGMDSEDTLEKGGQGWWAGLVGMAGSLWYPALPLAGWLLKEGRIRRRRFFVLSKKGLNYYRSEDTSEPPAGTVHLNW